MLESVWPHALMLFAVVACFPQFAEQRHHCTAFIGVGSGLPLARDFFALRPMPRLVLKPGVCAHGKRSRVGHPILMAAKKSQGALDVCGDGGCKKVILEEGVGTRSPVPGDVVQVKYFISVGGQLVDSSDGPFDFELGLNPSDAIKCWEAVIPTMKEKETSLVSCAPSYAFGAKGAPPKIPPNATLECELQLISWIDKAKERVDLAETYTPTDTAEEEVYDNYKESIQSENAVNDLNVTATGKPHEFFKLNDPRIRAVTSRQQRVAGKAVGYRWTETEDGIDIFVFLPKQTKANAVLCEVKGSSLAVGLKGEAPLLQGELEGEVYATESVWAVTDDDPPAVQLNLRKKPSAQRIWATVIRMPDAT